MNLDNNEEFDLLLPQQRGASRMSLNNDEEFDLLLPLRRGRLGGGHSRRINYSPTPPSSHSNPTLAFH